MSYLKEEQELLNSLIAGDKNSAREFFKRYGGLILFAIRSVRLYSDAVKESDLFNSAVLHILDQDKKVLKQYQGKCSLSSYLYIVCRRYALDVVKHENPVTEKTGDDSGLDNLAFELIDEETYPNSEQDVLRMAFKRLDQGAQIFIKMAVFDKLPVEEIMQFYGWKKPDFVYKKKHNVINTLRKEVNKLMIEKRHYDDK